ncbi:MAG: hypothetical protein Q4B34_01900 [Candidatus Saccharibacteria bacterium]|nr:hypothetical protein [Candidatus Saccharibacteria bacterium]
MKPEFEQNLTEKLIEETAPRFPQMSALKKQNRAYKVTVAILCLIVLALSGAIAYLLISGNDNHNHGQNDTDQTAEETASIIPDGVSEEEAEGLLAIVHPEYNIVSENNAQQSYLVPEYVSKIVATKIDTTKKELYIDEKAVRLTAPESPVCLTIWTADDTWTWIDDVCIPGKNDRDNWGNYFEDGGVDGYNKVYTEYFSIDDYLDKLGTYRYTFSFGGNGNWIFKQLEHIPAGQ